MIGILFHGPEVFDTGWAQRIIEGISAVEQAHCILAGTMGRTALIDSGLQGIECPGEQPSDILRKLQRRVGAAVLAVHAKSEQSGLMLGAMIRERSGIEIPLLQMECCSGCYVEWVPDVSPAIIEAAERMGLRRTAPLRLQPSTWERDGRIFRRLATAAPGEFVLLDGIVIGRARGQEITIECEGRRIVAVSGADAKRHGIEKIERLGGVDLKDAKLASTSSIRRTAHVPRVARASGAGLAFVDHAGMRLYELIRGREGAVTIGDDTTAVAGEIMYRFDLPLIGVTDGDRDTLLGGTRLAPGSTVFRVRDDDRAGARIYVEIFHRRPTTKDGFATVRERIAGLLGDELVGRRDC